jgi:hypothetical protein
MGLIPAILVITIAAALPGAIIFWRGWHGRRVGVHPFCRRCGFDLFGKPADSTACPECGAHLASRRATVVGVRQHKPALLTLGSFLLLFGLTPIALVAWGRYRNIDWQRHKPVGWLLHEAGSSTKTTQDAALKELIRRLTAGTLTKVQVTRAVDWGLKVQGDAAKPWNAGWGDLIEAARAAGSTSDSQWETYCKQAAEIGWLTARLRPKIRRGDATISELAAGTARVGTQPTVFAVIREAGLVIDGKQVLEPADTDSGGTTLSSTAVDSIAGTSPELDRALRDMPLGLHRGFLRVKLRLISATAAPYFPRYFPRLEWGSPAMGHPWMRQQALRAMALEQQALQDQQARLEGMWTTWAHVELQLPVHFELVGPDQPVGDAITDESLRAAIESSLSVRRITIHDQRVDFELNCNQPPPVSLYFKVLLRAGPNEWPVGRATIERVPGGGSGPGGWGIEYITGELPPGAAPAAGTFDVVLRPDVDPDDFGRRPDRDSYWGREVILKNIPVQYPWRRQ